MREKNENMLEENKLDIIKITKEWIVNIGTVIAISLVLWYFVVYSVWIESGSMIPTLQINDRLISTRVHNPKNLKEGDIVIFYSDELNKTLIKRLIGLPGDKIEIKHGVVFRNGKKLKEDYVKNDEECNQTFNVPIGKYFFLGDNRANSADARYWANPYIDEKSIQGKAQIKFYPFNDIRMLK